MFWTSWCNGAVAGLQLSGSFGKYLNARAGRLESSSPIVYKVFLLPSQMCCSVLNTTHVVMQIAKQRICTRQLEDGSRDKDSRVVMNRRMLSFYRV